MKWMQLKLSNLLRWNRLVQVLWPALVLVSSTDLPVGQRAESFKLVSEAVVLDLVARDRKGQPITDLAADDFQVFENGKRQEIRSVRLIGAGGAPSRTQSDSEPSASPIITGDPQTRVVSLLFDRLSVEGRRYAREAATDVLKADLPPHTRIGVFAIENGLLAICPFTTDFTRVRESVQLATSGSFQEIFKRSREIREQMLGGIPIQLEPSGSEPDWADRISSEIASGSAGGVSRAVEQYLTLNILANAAAVQTEFQGQTVLEGIEALVTGQREIPGRKTVLLFSEGIYLPEKLVFRMRNVTSQANLANVSLYTVDARGLTSQSQNQAGAAALGRAASLSQTQVQSGGVTAAATSQAAGTASRSTGGIGPNEMRSLETAEDSIRMNVQETLDDLSRSTGGFLTANTNDPGRVLRRMIGELQQYYEIVYTSDADPADPAYRKVEVKVLRDSVTVQTRDGYFPFPVSGQDPAAGFEASLLAVLDSGVLPHDFPLRSSVFHFNSKGVAFQQVVAAGVHFQRVEFRIDEESRHYRAHLSILARVKDDQGNSIVQLSRDYPIEGPLQELEQIRKGELVFLRSAEIRPGRYHLEVAALDHNSGKFSTKRQVLVVSPGRPGIGLSSLVLVGSLEPLSDLERLLSSPLKHLDHRVIPHIGSEIEASVAGEIPVYCLVYPGSEQASELTIALFRDGEPLFRGTPDLIPVSGPGEMAAFFSIPTANLGPGTYQLKAWAQQGEDLAVESTVFTLRE